MGMPKINAIQEHLEFPRRDLPGLFFVASHIKLA
jgi:hypothetical protein